MNWKQFSMVPLWQSGLGFWDAWTLNHWINLLVVLLAIFSLLYVIIFFKKIYKSSPRFFTHFSIALVLLFAAWGIDRNFQNMSYPEIQLGQAQVFGEQDENIENVELDSSARSGVEENQAAKQILESNYQKVNQLFSQYGMELDAMGNFRGAFNLQGGRMKLKTGSVNSRVIKDGSIQDEDIDSNINLHIKELITKDKIEVGGLATFKDGIVITSGGLDMSGGGISGGAIVADTFNGNVISAGSGTLTLDTYVLTLSGDSQINQSLLTTSSPTFAGLTLNGNLILGGNTLTTSNTGLVANLNADLFDSQEGSFYLDLGNATNQAAIDHGSISGLLDDDHTQYALLAGRDGDIFSIDQVRAYDSAGLGIYDDGGTGIFVEDGGQVGIGTTNPEYALDVTGDGRYTGSLSVEGGFIMGTTSTDYLEVNGTLNSHLIPASNNTYDLGSVAYYYRNVYTNTIVANNISAAGTNISGTSAETLALNTDNVTADAEDSTLIFTRGTVTPNATIAWNSTSDRIELNQDFWIEDETPATGSTLLTVKAGAGQGTDNLTQWLDNSENVLSVVNEAGYLGIGTTDPSVPLEVEGYSYIDTLRLTGITGGPGGAGLQFGGTNLSIYAQTANELRIRTNSADRLVIDSSGNVGIGTTNPSEKLHVYYQDDTAYSGSESSNALPTGINALFQNPTITAGTFGGIGFQTRYSRQAYIGALATGGEYTPAIVLGQRTGAAAFTERMRIDMTGNVGIGTTNPSGRLYISGSSADNSIPAAGSPSVHYLNITNGSLYGMVQGILGSGASYIQSQRVDGTATTYNLLLQPNGGNVGIGTTSPTKVLHVVSANNSIAIFRSDGQSADLSINGSSTPSQTIELLAGSGDSLQLSTNNTTNNGLFINTSGNVGIGTTAPGAKLQVRAGDPGSVTPQTWGDILVLEGSSGDGMTIVTPDAYGSNIFFGFPSDNDYSGISAYGPSHATRPGEMFIKAAGSEVMTFKAGNVGIGTTSPVSSLVVGVLESSADYTRGNLGIKSDASGYAIMLQENSGAEQWALGINSAGDLNFFDSGDVAPAVIFKDGGYVGIGTTSPGALLHVSLSSLEGTPSIASTTSAHFQRAGSSASDNIVSIQAGSAGNALLYFGDKDAQLSGSIDYDNNDNSMNFATNTTTKMIITSSGNVGIGTTAPAELLQIGSTSSGGNAYLRINANGGGYSAGIKMLGGTAGIWTLDYSDVTNSFSIDQDGTDHFTILNGGNVGIGTTSPLANLQILGDASSNSEIIIATQTSNVGISSLRLLEYGGRGGQLSYSASNNILYVEGGTAGNYSEIMTFLTDGSGNVGIGTTSPSGRLEVSGGNSYFTSPSGENRFFFAGLADDVAGYAKLTLYDSSEGAQIALNTEGDSYFTGGDLGVGVAAPARPLHVYDSSTDVVARFQSGDANAWIDFRDNTSDEFAVRLGAIGNALTLYSGGSETVRLDDSGNVGIGTTGPDALLTLSQRADDSGFKIYGYDDVSSHYATISLNSSGVVSLNTSNSWNLKQGGSTKIYISSSETTIYDPIKLRYDSTNIIFGEDRDYALGYNTTDDTFRIADGDDLTTTPRIILNSSGNVGIGTTAPTSALDVNGEVRISNGLVLTDDSSRTLTFDESDGTDSWHMALANSGQDLGFVESGIASGRLYLQAGGNVGIGTTSPSNTLHVDGGVLFGTSAPAVLSSGYMAVKRIYSPNNSNLELYSDGGIILKLDQDATSSGTDIFEIRDDSDNGLFTLKENGNVGIGTTSPDEKLQIGDDVFSETATPDAISLGGTVSNAAGANLKLIIYDNGSVESGFGISSNKLDYVSASTSIDHVFYSTSANEIMRIDSGEKILNIGGSSKQGHNLGAVLETNVAADYGGAEFNTWSDASGNRSLLYFNRSNSDTIGTHTLVSNNNSLGTIVFTGSDGTGWENAASIGVEVDATPGTDDMPGRIIFSTTPDGSKTLAERMRIDSSGNVGIGTTDPGALLSVVQDGEAWNDGLRISRNSYDWDFVLNNSGKLYVGYEQSTQAVIDTSGNVGIGTENPNSQLQLTHATSSLTTESDYAFSIKPDETAELFLGVNTTGGYSFIQSFDPGTGWSTKPLSLMPNGGNVGIGTTSPSADLHILEDSGNATEYLFTNSANDSIFWFGTDLSGSSNYSFIGYDDSADTLSLGTGSTFNADLVIDTSGNVGIGTTSPTQKLTINSGNINLSASYGYLFGDASLGMYWPSGTNNINFKTSNLDRMTVSSVGVGIGTTSPGYKLEVAGDVKINNSLGLGIAPSSTSKINIEQDSNYAIYSGANSLTDPVNNAANMRFQTSLEYTGVGTTKAFLGALYGQVKPIVNAGGNNSASVYGTYISTLRNIQDASNDDDGTLAGLFGATIQYGHYNLNASAAPVTTGVYGIKLSPYYRTGTIGNLYDLYIDSPSAGGTVSGSHFSIYQQATTSKNYFAGDVGIGTATPSVELQVDGRIGLGTLGYFGYGAAYLPNNTGYFQQYDATDAQGFWFNLRTADNTEDPLFKILDSRSNSGAFAVNSRTGESYFSGSLGIGTSSPSDVLTVKTTSDNYGITLQNSSGTSLANIIEASSDAGALTLKDGGSTKIFFSGNADASSYINNGGNLGVGIAATQAKLDVYDEQATAYATDWGSYVPTSNSNIVRIANSNNSTSDYYSGLFFQVGASTQIATGMISLIDNSSYGGDFAFQLRQNSGSYTLREVMRIKESGYVGIGTTNPSYNLHVASTIGVGVGGGGVITSDGQLNLRSPALQGIMFQTGGANNRMWINASGDVGINTTGPDRKLDVLDASSPQLRLTQSDATNYTDFQTDSSGYLHIEPSGDAGYFDGAMYIRRNNSSQLIPERYTADTGSPSLDFHKSRNTTFGSHTIVQSGDYTGYIDFKGSDGSAWRSTGAIFSQVDGTPGASDMPGRLVFSTTADGAANPTERMRINSSGYVGIGTTNPVNPLDVVAGGDEAIRVRTASGTTVISMGYDSGGNGVLKGMLNNDLLLRAIGNSSATEGIKFQWDASDAGSPTTLMSVLGNGRVGIGTTNPSYKVDIYSGSGEDNRIRFSQSGDSIAGGFIGRPADSSDLRIQNSEAANITLWTSNTERARIDSSGNVTISSLSSDGAVYSSSGVLTNTDPSDLRLKKNIETMDDVLEKLLGLRPVTYEWKDSTDDRVKRGFIAQEVEEIFPELIGKLPSGYKGIYSQDFIPYIVKGIQEQQGVINENQTYNLEQLGLLSDEQSDINNQLELTSGEMEDLIKENQENIQNNGELISNLNEQLEDLETRLGVIDTNQETQDLKIAYLENLLGINSASEGDVEVLGKVTAASAEVLGVFKTQEIETENIKMMGDDSSGKSTIEAGEEEILIESSLVDENSKIYLTPLSKLEGRVLWVDPEEIISGESFVVKLDGEVLENKVEFNWMIVN